MVCAGSPEKKTEGTAGSGSQWDEQLGATSPLGAPCRARRWAPRQRAGHQRAEETPHTAQGTGAGGAVTIHPALQEQLFATLSSCSTTHHQKEHQELLLLPLEFASWCQEQACCSPSAPEGPAPKGQVDEPPLNSFLQEKPECLSWSWQRLAHIPTALIYTPNSPDPVLAASHPRECSVFSFKCHLFNLLLFCSFQPQDWVFHLRTVTLLSCMFTL